MPDGAVNLTPTAGDIVIMREAPTGCLHGVMPWTSTTRQRRTFTMRYKSGREWSSHRDHPDHVHRPVCVDPDIRKRLRLPQQTRLLPETVALVSGDSDALIGFAHSALAAWKHPPVPEHRAPLWRSGRNLSCALPPGGSPLMTAEMRFLMDACGFLHLRAVLSPAEVDAACAEYTEALEDGNIIGRPALEHLVTHPRLLPIYHEFAGECFWLHVSTKAVLCLGFFATEDCSLTERHVATLWTLQGKTSCIVSLWGCYTTHLIRTAQTCNLATYTVSESMIDTMQNSALARVVLQTVRDASPSTISWHLHIWTVWKLMMEVCIPPETNSCVLTMAHALRPQTYRAPPNVVLYRIVGNPGLA